MFRLLDWFLNPNELKHLRFSANKDHQTPPPGFDWESCIFEVKACIEKDACGKRLFLSDSRFFFTQHRCWPLHPKQMTLNHPGVVFCRGVAGDLHFVGPLLCSEVPMPAVAPGAEGEEQVGMDVDGAGKLVVESSGVPGFCSTG